MCKILMELFKGFIALKFERPDFRLSLCSVKCDVSMLCPPLDAALEENHFGDIAIHNPSFFGVIENVNYSS